MFPHPTRRLPTQREHGTIWQLLHCRMFPADAQTVKVQYKTTDESQWHDAEVNSERTAAIARPEFTSHTSADWTTLEAANVKPYKRKVAGTGILDGKTYQYKLIVDSFESEVAEFDSAAANLTNPAIPTLDQKELSCYTTENNTDATWWGSGNNTFAKSLCKHATQRCTFKSRKWRISLLCRLGPWQPILR